MINYTTTNSTKQSSTYKTTSTLDQLVSQYSLSTRINHKHSPLVNYTIEKAKLYSGNQMSVPSIIESYERRRGILNTNNYK